MGYYASWEGFIRFKTKPEKEQLEALHDALCCDDFNQSALTASYSGYSKYYGEDIGEILDSVAPSTEEGELTFTGDDGAHWRFIFKNKEWQEENGFVYYESDLPKTIKDITEFLGQIIDRAEDVLEKHLPKHELPIFYGNVFDEMYCELKDLIKSWGVIHEEN